MVNIDQVDSEVVVEGSGRESGDARPDEVRVEEVRELVRELVRDEIARFLRTEAAF